MPGPYHEKVILASMPLGDHELVLITVDVTVKNFQVIMRKVTKFIRRYAT